MRGGRAGCSSERVGFLTAVGPGYPGREGRWVTSSPSPPRAARLGTRRHFAAGQWVVSSGVEN